MGFSLIKIIKNILALSPGKNNVFESNHANPAAISYINGFGQQPVQVPEIRR